MLCFNSACVVFAACSGEGLVCSKKSVVGLEARFLICFLFLLILESLYPVCGVHLMSDLFSVCFQYAWCVFVGSLNSILVVVFFAHRFPVILLVEYCC